MIERIPFNEVFTENPDGSLTPLREINVSGVNLGTGVSFQRGVTINGVNFSEYKQFDIAAENINGILVIKGYYEPPPSQPTSTTPTP